MLLEDTERKTALALAKAAYIDARCELCERSLGIINNSDGMRSHRAAVAGAEFEYLLGHGKSAEEHGAAEVGEILHASPRTRAPTVEQIGLSDWEKFGP